MKTQRDVNIRIHDNRGLATLVGFVFVLVLSRLWWTGMLTELFSAAYAPKGDGMTSASYMLLAFAANLIYGIGTVVVLAWSGLWWIVMDFVAGFRQLMAERSARVQVASEVVEQAVVDEVASGVESDPIAEALQTIDANIRTTHEQVQSIASQLGDLAARVSAVEYVATPVAGTTPKTTTRAKAAK